MVLRGKAFRVSLFVLVAVLLAFLTVACAGDSSEGGDVGGELSAEQRERAEELGLDPDKPYAGTELNFLICCHTAPQFASLDNLTNEEFTELTGISVSWGEVPFGSFQEKVVAEASTGGGTYDLVAWVDAWGPSLEGFLVPLNEKIEQSNVDMNDYPQAFQEAVTLGSEDDTVYGMPLRGHPLMFFYRTDIYEQLGLEPPETFSDFEEHGQQIKQNSGSLDIQNANAMYYGRSGGQNMWLYLSHLWSNGSDVFDENYRPVFNNQEGVEAMERYVGYLRDEEITPPASQTWNEQEANQAFNKGRVANFMGWWWMYSIMTGEDATEQVRNNVGFAPMPAWEGKEAVTYGLIWPAGILQNSSNQDAAWEYLKWMTSAETEKQVVMRDDNPDFNTNVAVRMSNLRDEEVNEQSGGLHNTAADILEEARTTPLVPEWPEVSEVLSTAVNEVANGGDAQSVLDDAANEVEGIMQRAGYYDE